MLTEKIKEVLLLILITLAIATVHGQQANMTEEDVIAKAKVLFDEEKWVEALPLFAQLVSVHPEISEYNYKFGVCSLLGNRTDRRRPIRYLTKAHRSMTDNDDLLYYLGLAYYQNQEFANAMKFLNLYLAKLDANSTQRPQILEQINACLNGMNLEHKNLIDEVLSKTEFQVDNFYRAYRADDLNGSLILKPENFISSKEKNSGQKSFVFVSEPRGILYYSGYGENSQNHRDIYKVELKSNGDWGKPIRITDLINTNFDEAYPVLTDNGQTLYFSSKGHNSLGGYDIFKSTFNPETEEFGTPENMGMGINSPFDDILFIPDNSGNGAFFASNRDNLEDGINVFRIRLNTVRFEDQQMLAEQSIQSKLENAVADENANAATSSVTPSQKNELVAQNTVTVDPQKKAETLVRQKAYVNKLADTAYLLVSNMKNQIRDLTNKRDRANMISSGKADKAKNLEVEFENIINNLPAAASKEEFEKELAQALKYKEDIYQYRQRADQANLIAWNLGKQLKIKNEELKQLKLDAGEVQTLSLSGDFEKTKATYANVMQAYRAADTLADYSQNINWVNLDKITFDIPKTEIAFADKMREGYENQTLLAMTQANKVENENYNATVPINVVDNRTSTNTPPKPVVVVLKQVEEINSEYLTAGNEMDLDDELELQFGVDAIEPYQLITPVSYTEIASSDAIPDDELLEIQFTVDALKPYPLVEQVLFEDVAFAEIDETVLEINHFIDRIEAEPLVQPIEISEEFYAIKMDEEVLETNDRADWITPEELVLPVTFDETAYALIIDENLDIDNKVDWIEPANVVQQVQFDETAYALNIEDENIDIDNKVDWIEPANVVQQVQFDETAYALNIEDEDIDIDNKIDWIEPENVVQQVQFDETAYALNIEDEGIDIDNKVDWIEPANVVQQVQFDETAYALNIEDENIDIDNKVDWIEPANVVLQVQFDETAYALNIEDENIAIDNKVDWIEPENLVQQIAYQSNDAVDLLADESLEINMEADPVNTLHVVNPVFYSEVAMEMETEELELQFDADAIEALQVVEQVAYTDVVAIQVDEQDLEISDMMVVEPYQLVEKIEYNDIAASNMPLDETLDVEFYHDQVKAAQQVQAVSHDEFVMTELPEEDLEINIEKETIEAYALVHPVTYSSIAMNDNTIPEEDLEMNFSIDAVEPFDLVQPVYSNGALTTDLAINDELEIGFDIDQPVAVEAYDLVKPVTYNEVAYFIVTDEEMLEVTYGVDEMRNEGLMADNASISARDVRGIPEMPAAGTELYYLRESVSMAANIETSRNDFELLNVAIESPEDLSYEELLFAASLAPIPEDKLRIYNYAFIHIDRDWRAFNNAAVTAMGMKDLDQAEVYLYQASLISSDNGKVENNKGILACYKSDFNSAESHFLAANQMGVNADYNLQLIQSLLGSSNNKSTRLKSEMGNVKMKRK